MNKITKSSMLIAVMLTIGISAACKAEPSAESINGSSYHVFSGVGCLFSGRMYCSQDSKITTEQLSDDLLNGKITIEQFKEAMANLEQEKITNE